jgi:malic enzyme
MRSMKMAPCMPSPTGQGAGADIVNKVYHVNDLTFGPNYFIPKPVDPRLITEESAAVAKAA